MAGSPSLRADDASPDASLHRYTLMGAPQDSLLLSDLSLLGDRYAFGGEDLFSQFIKFLFPITGREKRTMFLPNAYWGPKKPQYAQFDWQEYQTNHFVFYAYPQGAKTLEKVIRFIEDDYERNNEIFGVGHQFTKKIPVIFYQSRRDFEQTFIVGGPIPEGLGGVTEIFSWKRAVFPFEGNLSKLEHVVKHESTHIYQIAKGGDRNLPLWFIEGNAETNSIYWDAEADMMIRDAYLNGLFLPIDQLWQIQGTYLMYKFGNFICNELWDNFGTDGFRKIYDNAKDLAFEDNLKKSLGITVEELDRRVQERLSRRYGDILRKEADLVDQAKKLKEREFLMASHEAFYVSGGSTGPRLALYLNHVGLDGKLTRKRIEMDRRFRTDSLNYFKKGAFINAHVIAYAVRRGPRDELRVVPYRFDETRRKFSLGPVRRQSWPNIESIERPVVLEDGSVAFIGYENGYSALYMAKSDGSHLTKIFGDGEHLSDLDYSPARKAFVFSREEGRHETRIRYDRNLYLLSYPSLALTPLTQTPDLIEEQARFSPSGNYVLYVADPEGTYDLHLFNLQSMQPRQMTKLKVGAKQPHWGPRGSILFNGFKKFAPSIYQAAFPDPQTMITATLAQGETFPVRIESGKLWLTESPVRQEELGEGPLWIKGKGLVVQDGGQEKSVGQVAHIQDALILKTNSKVLGTELMREELYVWKDKQLQSLRARSMPLDDIPKTVLKQLEQELDGRPILSKWWDASTQEAVVVVNNRLAKDAQTYKDKPELSTYRYRASGGLEEIEGLVVDGFDLRIQWLHFMKDRRVFLAVGERRSGPFHVYVAHPGASKAQLIQSEVDEYRVAPDGSSSVLRKGRDLSMVSYDGRDMRLLPRLKALATFHYLEKRPYLWVASVEDNTLSVIEIDPATLESKTYPPTSLSKEDGPLRLWIDEVYERVLVHSEPRKGPKLPQKLTLISPNTQGLYELSEASQGIRFANIRFRQGYLFFDEYQSAYHVPQTHVWANHVRDSLDEVVRVSKDIPSKWIIESRRKLFLFDTDTGKAAPISGETYGFSVRGTSIVYAAPFDDTYQLFEYDPEEDESDVYHLSKVDTILPTFKEEGLYVLAKQPTGWTVQTLTMPTPHSGESDTPTSMPTVSEVDSPPTIQVSGLERIGSDLVGSAVSLTPTPYRGPHLLPPQSFSQKLVGQEARIPFRLQNIAAAAAYDGRDFRFFLSGYLDNIFSDQGVYANAIFLGGSRFATLSFVDLRHSWNYSLFFNDRLDVQNYGLGVTKVFVLDRQREVNLYTNYEVQRYGLAQASTARIITPDVEGRDLHLFKTGAVYAYDVTLWDRHGPFSGSRFFAHTELGFDMGGTRLANVDVNMDMRLYNHILPRFGLAHRFMAGTSQGEVPSIFLVGGNMTFRGVGFDDLDGQNFWIFSEDVRLPLLDFVGAKFFDPVDQFLGLFTRYFDVRTGWFVDVGSVWYNTQPMNIDYASGYFVNIPTLLGINFRLHHSFLGNKNIGFWIGSNW